MLTFHECLQEQLPEHLQRGDEDHEFEGVDKAGSAQLLLGEDEGDGTNAVPQQKHQQHCDEDQHLLKPPEKNHHQAFFLKTNQVQLTIL